MNIQRVKIERDCEVGIEELSARERIYVDMAVVRSRWTEWIAGRRAARRAVASILGPCFSPRPDTWDVLAGPGGEPVVHGVGREVYVSITHTRGVAVAVADFRPVGVDLEAPVRRSCPTQVGFLTPDELRHAWVREPDRRSRLLATYWTLKESAAKAVRLAIPPERFVVRLRRNRATVSYGRRRFSGAVSLVGACTLAVVRG